jgi:5S rRNA maturation endonuclease (ribonuclease M5)
VYQVVRYQPKSFRQRRPVGNREWVWDLKGVDPVLYRLPEVLKAVREARRVFVCEGEKDANTLADHGLIATTNNGGADAWQPGLGEALAGAQVVIIPDRDEAGHRHAEKVAASLRDASSVKVLELPNRDGLNVKDVTDWLNAGGTVEELWKLVEETPEYQAPREDLPALLRDVETFVSQYVACGHSELAALTLWVAHTWAMDAAECTPYLHITSPEKQSGKTRLLETLSQLVKQPWHTSRASAAVLVRKVATAAPTLLLDETDSAFKSDKEYAETLRGVLDAGYRKGGVASLCVKAGGDFELRDFPVFCPKALAGIGELPDTIADRSVRISLKRRAPWETVQRFRLREAKAQAEPLRERLGSWAANTIGRLVEAQPDLPEALSDRACDVWEPLLAIADLADGDWPGRTREAAIALTEASTDSGMSLGSRLLSDIREVVDGRVTGPIATTELVSQLLARDEAPWGDLKGKELDARSLSRLLKPYGIKPKRIRTDIGSGTVRGYGIEDLQDAFQRYLQVYFPGRATRATNSGSKRKDVADLADVAANGGYADIYSPRGGTNGTNPRSEASDVPDVLGSRHMWRILEDKKEADGGMRI